MSTYNVQELEELISICVFLNGNIAVPVGIEINTMEITATGIKNMHIDVVGLDVVTCPLKCLQKTLISDYYLRA